MSPYYFSDISKTIKIFIVIFLLQFSYILLSNQLRYFNFVFLIVPFNSLFLLHLTIKLLIKFKHILLTFQFRLCYGIHATYYHITPLITASENGFIDIVKLLLSRPEINVNCTTISNKPRLIQLNSQLF